MTLEAGVGTGVRGACLVAMLVLLPLFVAACNRWPCATEGHTYLAKHFESECCEGLVSIDSVGPSEDGSTMEGLPEGCVRDGPPRCETVSAVRQREL